MSLLWSSDGREGSVEPSQWRDDARSRGARVCNGGMESAMTDVAVQSAPEAVLYKIPEVMRVSRGCAIGLTSRSH